VPQDAETTSSENLPLVSRWPFSHTPSSLAGKRLSQQEPLPRPKVRRLTFAFHPFVTAEASIFSRSKSTLSFTNSSGSSCLSSSPVSPSPVSLPMSLTSCSDGRSTNGTSSRARVGPKLRDAVWIVRRSGEAKTISTSLWYGNTALRARHCSLPFAVRTASRIV
jgi:hypothetical protein